MAFLTCNSLFVLIETSWNVKILGWFPASNCTGINRNIVECKAFFWMRSRTQKPGINRNIVECKDRYPSIHSPLSFVLIETSWNVKPNWWYYIIIKGSINRNIVECKGRCIRLVRSVWYIVLIETSWNVKKPMRKFHFNVQLY